MLEYIAPVLSAVSALLSLIILIIVLITRKKSAVGTDNEIVKSIKDETSLIKTVIETSGRQSSQSLFEGVKATNNQVLESVKEINKLNSAKITEMREELSKSLNDMRHDLTDSLKEVRTGLKDSLKDVRDDNEAKLKEIRDVVDEKLSETLNKRLTESFNVISERLEAVSKGLGEMQTLAGGVNDLKRVLSNVKTRGIWGEIALEALLSDILVPEQYEKNCNVGGRGCRERVDFAIILPGSGDEKLYLPIDVKFPVEDFHRLIESGSRGDAAYADIEKQFIKRIKEEAKSIKDKYIKPPHTTDFAVLYLPVESLYAEVLKVSGLQEKLQKEYNVIPAGPTTVSALLQSLRMGFKTLKIQKCSKEIFSVLTSFQKDFDRFANLVEQAHTQINRASDTLDDAGRKTKSIKKQLSKIENFDMIDSEDNIPLIG